MDDIPSENLIKHFEDTYKFIEEGRSKGNRIFVHCEHGMSRSPTIVTAYIMKNQHIGWMKALHIVKVKHAKARPNQGFQTQLMKYQAKLGIH